MKQPYVHLMAPKLALARQCLREGRFAAAVHAADWLIGFTRALRECGVDTCSSEYQAAAYRVIDEAYS